MEEKVREFLNSQYKDGIIREDNFRGDLSFYVKADQLFDICQALFEETSLDVRFLKDITSVDWLGHEEEMGGRFEVVYNLYSLRHKFRFFLKVMLPGDKPVIASLTPLWNGANWLEREVWDMMGIEFTGHPDLTRILTPDGFEGHPLRRDFPLTWEVPQFNWNKDKPPEVMK